VPVGERRKADRDGEPAAAEEGRKTDHQVARRLERLRASRRQGVGPRCDGAEVAWGTRAREADGGWELRFPASR